MISNYNSLPLVSRSCVVPAPSNFNRGFTLIELLAVIAVVGVLFAILIPMMSKQRESAIRVQCSSNMRQVGVCFSLYSNDHSGRLPRNDESSIYSDKSWVGQLAEYVDDDFEVFGCPAGEGPQPRTSYLYNAFAAGRNVDENVFVRANAAENVVTSILVLDQRVNTNDPFTSSGTVDTVENSSANWWYPHSYAGEKNMGRTVLFLDGHVEIVKKGTLHWWQLQWPD